MLFCALCITVEIREANREHVCSDLLREFRISRISREASNRFGPECFLVVFHAVKIARARSIARNFLSFSLSLRK